jgi:flagellar basal body-associated protein FliL
MDITIIIFIIIFIICLIIFFFWRSRYSHYDPRIYDHAPVDLELDYDYTEKPKYHYTKNEFFEKYYNKNGELIVNYTDNMGTIPEYWDSEEEVDQSNDKKIHRIRQRQTK